MTFVAGTVLTAAALNSELASKSDLASPTFTGSVVLPFDTKVGAGTTGFNSGSSYTPTLGGAGTAIGNGTIGGAYWDFGNWFYWRASVTLGSTSTIGSGPTITLPFSINASGQVMANQHVVLQDASSGLLLPGQANNLNSSTVVLYALSAGLAYTTYELLSATVPFTWTTSDTIRIVGFGEKL